MIDLSIVIVSWNARQALRGCLESVIAQDTEPALEVLVIDNASSDGSAEMVDREFPAVQVLRNAVNAGFAKASNQGIRQARGRYVLLLNPDTIVRPCALERMLTYADAHPDIGALGPTLLAENGQIDYRGARQFPTLWSEVLKRLRLAHPVFGDNAMMNWDHRTSRDVEVLCGACMLVRREVIETVGLLDEGFFLFGEDVDWCFRIRRAGWRVFYLSQAEVMHLGGKSSELVRDEVGFEMARSRHRLLRKAYGPRAARLHRCILLFTELPKIGFWRVRGLLNVRAASPTLAQGRLRTHMQIVRWVLNAASVDVYGHRGDGYLTRTPSSRGERRDGYPAGTCFGRGEPSVQDGADPTRAM